MYICIYIHIYIWFVFGFVFCRCQSPGMLNRGTMCLVLDTVLWGSLAIFPLHSAVSHSRHHVNRITFDRSLSAGMPRWGTAGDAEQTFVLACLALVASGLSQLLRVCLDVGCGSVE